MKNCRTKKGVSLLLCALLLNPFSVAAKPLAVSPFQDAAAEGETKRSNEATGSISATLRFDYTQYFDAVAAKDITVSLLKEGTAMGSMKLTETKADYLGKFPVAVTAKNESGVEITTEREIGSFTFTIGSLPLGTYTLQLQGKGYKAFQTEITLSDYSMHVVIGTSNKTFTVGDVNQDNKVDLTDLKAMEQAIVNKSTDTVYDLNGDGKLNIVDLAYVYHEIGAAGDAEVYETYLISSKFASLDVSGGEVQVISGSAEQLFTPNSGVVKLKSTTGNGVTLPIVLQTPIEMEQIELIAPDLAGAPEKGYADVTYEEHGQEITEKIAYDISLPEDIHAIEAEPGQKTVVISLGKRVPVKKIVIHVERVAGQNGKPNFVVVEEIKFLKDILPDESVSQNNQVKDVTAAPANESVLLNWTALANVTGYTISYGTASGQYDTTVHTETPNASITGLKNGTTYYFIVTPVNGSWTGIASQEVSATPKADSAPLPPDFLSVTAMDQALQLSWKEAENADFYEVYLRKETEAEFQRYQEAITETSITIPALENGVEYFLYVVAGNDIGRSAKSKEVSGTPKIEDIVPPTLPTLNKLPLSNIESITMKNLNNVDKNLYPNGFDANWVADGNFYTHWAAARFHLSKEFTFTFKEAKEMDYLIYVPRLDGKFRESFARYTIRVWDEQNNETVVAQGMPFPVSVRQDGYAVLPFTKSMVKKLSVEAAQWEGSPTNISLAETVFYEYNPISDYIKALFADASFTALSAKALANPEETKTNITAYREELQNGNGYVVNSEILLDELNLAEALLKNNQQALGLVQRGIESRDASIDRQKYQQASSTLQPLGISAKANTEIVIYANIPEGEQVSVIPTQYYAEASTWQGTPIVLTNGRNVIKIPKIGSQRTERGGSLYLQYSGSKPEQITLQIRGDSAVQIPVLSIADWYSLEEAERRIKIGNYIDTLTAYVAALPAKNRPLQVLNATEISMPNVLLSIPADQALKGIDSQTADREEKITKLYQSMEAWEELMHIVNKTQGIDNTLENSDMQSRQNIRYMQMFAKAFMYAAGNHVGVGYGSCAAFVQGRPTKDLPMGATANGLFGWGIAHEIGHNMDKLGKAEITNNIYSLMVQTYDGTENTLNSRLEISNKYREIYQKTAEGYQGDANNVFVQLGLYWQLHLAYDDADGMDFYNRFFKAWKAGEESGQDYADRVALVASKTANKDLSEFFSRWGMVLSEATKGKLATYPKEERNIFYLNDACRRYRLAGGAGITGASFTAQASKDSSDPKLIHLTFTMDESYQEDLLGYEISRNGKVIAFVTENSYEDIIGIANHMAFSYEVKAIDKLGKVAATAQTRDIRISYDNTIPVSSYQQTIEADGTYKLTLDTVTPVSGIKLSGNVPTSGAYTVKLNYSVNPDTTHYQVREDVIAKQGDFSQNDGEAGSADFIGYFNKPGFTDTRIWTYDTYEVMITGLPADGVTVSLLGYVGDTIAFSEDAAIGRLKENYDTGDGVLEAGTLVYMGTYRGDPSYSIIKIRGQFAENSQDGESETMTERDVAGYALLFAEVPEDGKTSTISDGFFLFVPDIQKEAELQQKGGTNCNSDSLLPVRAKAQLFHTDSPDSAESQRLTSDTVWITSPSDASMPEILLVQ